MSQELEKPRTADSLYLARGDDVCGLRPVLTGDVFDEVHVREPDGTELQRSIIVVEHPCSLRVNGVDLISKIQVAAVRSLQTMGSWRGNFSRMPLPGLRGAEDAAAFFDDPYIVGPDHLMAGRRVACLSTHGVNLMLQRQVHRASRVVVPTHVFHQANEAVYEEADIIEEWCVYRCGQGLQPADAAAECIGWLRETVDGVRRQALLREPQQRSAVRKAMRQRLK